MGGEWRKITLGDVADLVRGVSYRPCDLLPLGTEGIPLLRATNIRNGTLELVDVLIVTPGLVRYHQLLRRFDVVIAMSSGSRDAVGRLAQLRQEWTGCVGAFCGVIRANPERMHPEYLGYVLQSPEFRTRIETHAVGTAIMNLSRERILGFSLQLPEPSEQRAIAHILGTLDDKIENLRKQNETLEAMARALFKAWFVDFEPVRAKIEGRWRRGESLPGLPAHLYDLFPDRLVESELGEIPEGWEIGVLGDVAYHPRRGIQPANIKPETPYIALEHMPKRCIALSDWGMAEGLESSKFEFKQGEILFGKLRPYFHKVGVAPVDGVCSTDIVVLAPRSSEWFGFVLFHASSIEFVEYTNATSTGTKMPRTSWNDMARYELVLPLESVAAAFTELVKPWVNGIIIGIHESRILAHLRDTLLPKLISGELRVKDAETFLERAGV